MPTEPNPSHPLERLRQLFGRRGIPVVRQMTPSECGVACLAMVLRFHGGQAELGELRAALRTGKSGVTASSLLRAGARFGLRGRGVSVAVEALGGLPRGAILHWGFNHFVVLDRVRSDGVWIVDPAVGRRFLPMEAVRTSFTGVAVELSPGVHFASARDGEPTPEDTSRRGWLKLLSSEWTLLRPILLTSLLIQFLLLATPLATRVVVDRVVPRGEVSLLLVLSVGVGFVVAFDFLASLVRGHALVFLRTRLNAKLTFDFVEHLTGLPFRFFQERSTGDLVMRLTSHDTVREIVTGAAMATLLDGGLVIGYLVLLFVAAPTLGALVLLLAVLRVATLLLFRPRVQALMGLDLETQARVRSFEVEMLDGMETIKALGAEHQAIGRWSNLFVDTLNLSLRRGKLDAWFESIMGGLSIGSPLVVLFYGAHLVMSDAMTLGEMLALLALATGFLVPVTSLVATGAQWQLLSSFLERIDDVMHSAPEQRADGRREVVEIDGAVRAERLTFRYASDEPIVIDDVSLEVAPGEFVAFVGRSGSGKSTLAKLLTGLYEPEQGQVLFGDVSLADMDRVALRAQLGTVTQDVHLFGGTIRQNIALGDSAMSIEDVEEAAHIAVIADDIRRMPLGYSTVLSDRGQSLSGGQRQRLALARAIARRPRVLVLDEATSALDAVTERAVYQELERLECTRIVVAHRLSTVRHADRILVLHEGRIVEQGPHDALVARGGVYASLVEAQLDGERVTAPRS